MYQGEVTVPKEDLDSFLSVTGELKIKGLVSNDGSPVGKEESKSPKRSGTDTPLFIAPPPKKEKDSILDSNNLDQILLEADDENFEKYLNSGSETYKCKKCSFECKSRYRLEYHEKSHHGHQDSSEYITKAAKESSPLLIDGIESFEMNEEEDFSDEERKLKDKLNDYKELLDHNNNRTYNSQDYQFEEDYGQNGLKISPEPTSNVKEEIIRDEEINKPAPIFTSEKGNLKLHLIKQHFDGTDRCTCTECDRVFSSYRSAKQHLEIVHNDSPIFYECTICHKVIKSKQMFRIHALNKHEIRGKKILSTYGKEVGEAEYLKQK